MRNRAHLLLPVSMTFAGVGCSAEPDPFVPGTAQPSAPASGGIGDGSADSDGGADSGDDAGDEDPEVPTTPEIPGFDIDAREGGWWKFRFSSDWDGGSPTHYQCVFLLVLGAPTEIDGDEAFAVDIEILGVDDPDYAPCPELAWDHLSFVGNRIRGERNGEFAPLFDAMTGVWPAKSDGLFGQLRASGLLEAYEDGSDWRVQVVTDTTGCEVIPGYGEVCTDEPEFYVGWELYRPGIGPAGSYFLGCSGGCLTEEYELLDASPDGDEPKPEGCPVGDGLYCGGNGVGGDPDVLYECVGGELEVYEECGVTCTPAPPESPDVCEW